MFLSYLFLGYCAVTLFGQGICFTTSRNEWPEKQPKYIVYQEKKTWDDARDFCDENGMALAFIMTYQEQKDLRNILIASNLLPKDEESGYWLGARAEKKTWRWEYNEEDPRDDHFMAGWHWFKPDYNIRKNGEPGECMELQFINRTMFDTSLSWNNLWCDEKRGFVCQVTDSSKKEDW